MNPIRLTRWRAATCTITVVVGGAVAVLRTAGAQERTVGGYIPAVHYSSGTGLNDDRVVVFPSGGRPVRLRLPFALGAAVFAPDGSGLYGISAIAPGEPGFYRLQLGPMRADLLFAWPLRMIGLPAVSRDQSRMVVLASPLDSACGIFAVSLPDGAIRKLSEVPPGPAGATCGPFEWSTGLSLSPDGHRAIGVRELSQSDHRLELVDLDRATITTVASGFDSAFWSPDGRWVAAVEYGPAWALTTLLEAKGFTADRSFTTSTWVAWSPDSRLLLTFQNSAVCALDYTGIKAELATVDVESGKVTRVSPECLDIPASRLGWVRASIAEGRR
jgi:hypothetical protein